MQMIRKRSVQYTSRKSSLCKRKRSSSVSKKSDDSTSFSKRFLLKTKSCIKKTGARKDVPDKRGRTIQRDSIRNCPSLKFSGEKFSHLGSRSSLENTGDDGGIRREKSRKKQKRKSIVLDEASRLQRRTRYLLIRMKLEQNLIDAYSAEGWKGQSREKIKPEKELQRARKQILNCKLGIRDAIHQLELLSSEGCIENSVIFPDGSVHHEHIFCAKCKSHEAFPDDDIVLCDGTCNCGFHQKCLEPPLAKIPPGDQGWLCKFCECKMEIIEAINAHLGTFFSVNSSWEDMFKEAVSSLDDGNADVDPAQEWPSEDSEDDDYNPDINEKSSSMGSIEDNILDDASSYSNISCFSGESGAEFRRPFNDGDRETKSYRRQRTDVDYKKLYAEMFGKDQHENEQSEDEDWGPHRRKQRKVASDDGTNMGSCGDDDQRPKVQFTGDMEKKQPSTSQDRKPLLRIPRDAVEKLRQVFAENELPTRAVKEDLSKQLGLTSEKVSKWFKNARYAALKIRKAEGAEGLSDYIKSSTKIGKNRSSSAATEKGRHSLLTSSSGIHVPRNVRKNLWRMTLKSIIPSLRKQHNRATSAVPSITTKASKQFDNVRLSKNVRDASAAFENNGSKECLPHHSSNRRGNKHLYLNELERLCNLYEKVTKLKIALGACEGHTTHMPQSTDESVIYVPVAKLKEKGMEKS